MESLPIPMELLSQISCILVMRSIIIMAKNWDNNSINMMRLSIYLTIHDSLKKYALYNQKMALCNNEICTKPFFFAF
jgi:hypothetical protein